MKNIFFVLIVLTQPNCTVCTTLFGSFRTTVISWFRKSMAQNSAKISVTLITLHVMLIKNVKIQFVSLNYKSSSSRRSSTCRASYYYWPFLKCRFSLSDAVKILNLLLCSINLLIMDLKNLTNLKNFENDFNFNFFVSTSSIFFFLF